MSEFIAKFSLNEPEPITATFTAYELAPNIINDDYAVLINKPSINGVTLDGDTSLNILGVQPKGDYATNSRVNQVENKIPKYVSDLDNDLNYQTKSEVETLINDVEEIAENAEAIAKGKATGYVFNTVDDMNTWIESNSSILKLGDNLYIRAVNVPDYWWDGTTAQQLETQKVDLTNYVQNTDVATSTKNGIVKANGSGGIKVNSAGNISTIKANESEITDKTNDYKVITPSNLDIAVKTSVTTNANELSEDEKTSAQTWLGLDNVVRETNYATSTKAGVMRPANGLFVSGNTGAIVIACASNAQIDAKTDKYYPIVPYNLNYAVNSVLPTMTQAEYEALVENNEIDENLFYMIVEE